MTARRGALTGATLLLVLVAVAVLVGSLNAPLGYDEAYNLQVPLHLAQEGRYATDGTLHETAGRAVFDHYITTGPTILAPTAALVVVGAESVVALRLAALGFYVALLLLAHRAGDRVGGPWAGLAAVAGVLSLDLRTDDGIGMNGAAAVLGEVPAAVFLLGGALVVVRRPAAAGALVGLAVLSKLLALLALPAFVAAVVVTARVASHGDARGRRSWVAPTVRLVCAAAGVVASWALLQLVVLGWGDWVGRTDRFLQLFVFGGSGLVDDADYQSSRWSAFVDSWAVAPAALVLAVSVAVLLLVARRAARPEGLTTTRASSAALDDLGLLVAAGGAAALTLAWWWLLAGRVLGRYLVTPLLLTAVLLCALAVVASGRLLRRRRTRVTVLAGVPAVAALGVLVGGHVVAAWGDHARLEEQRQVAAEADRVAEGRVAGSGWFQNPEIALLTGVPSLGEARPGDVLLLTADQRRLSPAAYEAARERCRTVLVETDHHRLCRVS